jgi:2-keto-4-pentenoate hydratase/2-oxohepta-3-ene-1,7-dioic acid hydratase in catechol pathway
MQLFSTDRGVGRRFGDLLEVLDVEGDLHDLVVTSRLSDVGTALVTATVSFDDVRLFAPVRPERLIQVGLNYASHLAEIGRLAPEHPMYAITDVGESLSDPDDVIRFPSDDPDQVDHECELAIVIGTRAHHVDAVDAWSVIAGVTACNDVSARGLQRAGFASGNLGAGKMLPGFKPLGPGLITAEEASQGPIDIRLAVNGDVRQQADSHQMVFSIERLIEILSAEHELFPGDVLMTGSPSGVGFFTGKYLCDGDTVEVFVGSMPPLRNSFTRG